MAISVGDPDAGPVGRLGFRREIATAPSGPRNDGGSGYRHREERSDVAISVGDPDAGGGERGGSSGGCHGPCGASQ